MPGATHTHPGSAIAQELVEELDLSAEDAWWKSSPKYIPVERVDCIHAYDAVRINSAFLNFLSQKNIPLHIYNYYGGYSGSYFPKDALPNGNRSEEHTSELQSRGHLVCRLLLEKKKCHYIRNERT